MCGAVPARVLEERREGLERWFEQGFEGEMSWLRRAWERRLDPSFIVPDARTVIVCAVNHKNEAWNQQVEPRIASYIYAPDYHVSVREMLVSLASRLGIRARAVCDTAPVLEKAWAVEAGLGWIGKNTLLITPEYGSFVSLGLLVTSEELGIEREEGVIASHEATKQSGKAQSGLLRACGDRNDAPPSTLHTCGSCRRCIDACPTGALVAPHILDARRCIAYQTLEELEVRSEELGVKHRQLLTGGKWLAGCDECQRACPHNQLTPLYSNPRFAPVIPAPAPAEFWHNLTRGQFDALLSRTVLARRGYDRLVRS